MRKTPPRTAFEERYGHPVHVVERIPESTGWDTAIDRAENQTSHGVLTYAGTRQDRDGNAFPAWHSPSVITEQVPVESFVELGIPQVYVTRKVRTLQTDAPTVVRRTGRHDRAIRRGKAGELDEVIIDTEPDEEKPRTSHERYTRDKERREGLLNTVYINYVIGTAPASALATHVVRFVRIKAATQRDLHILRNDSTPKNLDDYTNDFLVEVWPKIEAKEISGPLSHWLNKAFRLHMIDAKRETKREWDWKRFLATRVGIEDDTGFIHRPSEYAEEWDGGEPALPSSDDESPTIFDAVPAPAPQTRDVSRRAQDAAKYAWLRTHRSGREREVFDLMTTGRGGKEIARTLGLSESTVSRLRTKIETSLQMMAQQIASQEVAR